MKIQLIATGSTRQERLAERWGVAFLVGDDLLFDTFGQASVLLENMRQMRIDLAAIRSIVISHDDWDHVTGLWQLLPGRPDITVYICPHFHDEIKARIRSFGARVVEASGMMEIQKNVWTTGEMPGHTPGRMIYEQSLVVRSPKGLTVITGCAHPGILAITRQVKDVFKETPTLAIGGFHLKDNSDDENRAVAENLMAFGVRQVAPIHCTGANAQRLLRAAFADGYVELAEKSVLEA